jgi:hypothetical protein
MAGRSLERATERGARRTLVTDFGIAQSTAPHATTGASARLTQGGHLLGTLHDMSPEGFVTLPLPRRFAGDLHPGRVVTAWVGPTELRSLPPVVFGRVLVIEP